jgi:hypothetical protein
VLRTQSRSSFPLRGSLLWWMLHATWVPSCQPRRGEGEVRDLQERSRGRDFSDGSTNKENQELNECMWIGERGYPFSNPKERAVWTRFRQCCRLGRNSVEIHNALIFKWKGDFGTQLFSTLMSEEFKSSRSFEPF